MLLGQIYDIFFTGLNYRNAYDRLIKLEKYGYLKSCKVRIKGRFLTHFYVTEKSVDYVKETLKYCIVSPSISSSSIVHDLVLVDIRRALEQKECVKETIPENILQTTDCNEVIHSCKGFQSLNTDLAINVSNQYGTFWLPFEWEATEKGQSRIINKLTSYHSITELPAVFYICQSKRIENVIRKCESELMKDFKPKVFTCLIDDILKPSGKVEFKNINSDYFSIT